MDSRKSAAQRGTIAYILGSYPSRTETFIANEINHLEDLWPIIVFALNRERNTLAEENAPPVPIVYCPPLFSGKMICAHLFMAVRHPIGYWRSLFHAFSCRSVLAGLKAFWRSVFFFFKIKPLGIKHLHAHFASTPTDLAMSLSEMTHIPFSFSAHAHDIYTKNPTLIRKIETARFVVTCTRYNQRYLQRIGSPQNEDKICLVYHGIPLENWPFFERAFYQKDPILILTIGRLVGKKGYGYLLEALEHLKWQGISAKWTIVGEGPLKEELEERIRKSGLSEGTTFAGWKTRTEIQALFRSHDLFIQPSVIAQNGDRDGIPNVIFEAMATGIPTVATNVSAIPEVMRDENGVLVQPEDPRALADAIVRLKNNPDLRRKIVCAARQTMSEFDMPDHIRQLEAVFSAYIDLSKKEKRKHGELWKTD